MKIYLRYIFLALAATLMAVSCIEELELETPIVQDDVVTFVPRVQSFANRYVTKADYEGNETQISNHTVMVFNNDGNLVHRQYAEGDSPFRLNKSMLNSSANGDLSQATVVMLANMKYEDLSGVTVTKLSDFEKCTYKPSKSVITSLQDGFAGFPMIGGIKGVDLTSTKGQQSALEISLKILYAKINFQISVEQGGENQNVGSGMQFVLSECTVHNTATTTAIAIPASKGKPTVDFLGDPVSETNATADGTTASANYTGSTATSVGKTGTAKLDGDKIGFTFYVLESRYNHGSDLRGIYPDDSWLTSEPKEDVWNYNPDTDASKLNGVIHSCDDLIQQYKPKLAALSSGNPAGKATYVLMKGTYTDYRGVAWNVNYTIYLGKDNAQNFHIDRNSEYTNHIAIKGVRDRQEDAYGENDVWIDHRVNVTYNGSGVDDHVTITRETLLDAHIEVRPLRVKWSDDEYEGVRVYLPTKDGNLVDWIGIERFTGKNNADGSTYCLIDDEDNPGKKKSSGKRKYFTTDLISELQNKEGEYGVRIEDGKKYIYLLNGDCAWIYFDENLGTTDRDAEIKLEFYKKSGSTQNVVYKVKQRCLQTVGGYAIESYEEYLHSYDSEDKYNLSTSPVDYTQQGLAWGFPEHKLSQSILVNATDVPTSTLKEQIIKSYSYDYFHESDGPSYQLFTKTSGSWASASFGTGLYFTDRASANRDIAVKDMGTKPENAYQYCLSKNKFTTDGLGNVSMNINWYLPDVYEMQAILAASESSNSTADFDSDAFYWSSQPSFERLLDMEILGYELSLINEMPDKARAVSAKDREDEDLPRRDQHRIRCAYAKKGIALDEEDMEDRVPDGIDGKFSVYMKAWNDGSYGYFNYLLPAATEQNTSSKWVYNDERGTDYPNKDNASSISGEKFKYIKTTDKDGNPIEGFEGNPGEDWDKWTNSTEKGEPDGKPDYWTEYTLPVVGTKTGYYTTLATYPGLSAYTLDKYALVEAYKPTNTQKSGTQTDTAKFVKKMDKKLPSATDLRTFDHLNGTSMLNISFNQSNGSTLPAFVYDELVSGTITTNKRTWVNPTYTLVKHPMKSEDKTVSVKGSASSSGTSEGTRYGGSIDKARQNAFEGSLSNGWNGAYEKAKEDALTNLKNEISKNYSEWDFNESDVTYTPLTYKSTSEKLDDGTIAVQYSSESESKYLTCKSTCKVTLYATVTIKKTPELELFHQDTNTGMWNDQPGKPDPLDNSINADQLRMYCGNSFTISLTDAAKAEGYEISKVKVYYTGTNRLDNNIDVGDLYSNKVFARFVESRITLPKDSTITGYGSTETLKLDGMDYDDTSKWQQWTGTDDQGSVTLVLADYSAQKLANSRFEYAYDSEPDFPTKYIIVDQIEVKCSKKKKSEFDFAKIYKEGGNIGTSYCTVKHITFTVEGGTEENPSCTTAEGLKLYAGSKVTFKALDGYVINSISGDESLTFKGSKQTAEFPGLPEKTITAPIVVLYSKAASDTD